VGGGGSQGDLVRGKKGGLGLCDPRAVIGCTNLKHWKVEVKKTSGRHIGFPGLGIGRLSWPVGWDYWSAWIWTRCCGSRLRVRFWVILDWTREEGRRRTSVANFEKEEDKRSHGRKRKKELLS
jgi:hypothetical protein